MNDEESAPEIQRALDRIDQKRPPDKPSEIEIFSQPIPASIQRLIELLRESEEKRK